MLEFIEHIDFTHNALCEYNECADSALCKHDISAHIIPQVIAFIMAYHIETLYTELVLWLTDWTHCVIIELGQEQINES